MVKRYCDKCGKEIGNIDIHDSTTWTWFTIIQHNDNSKYEYDYCGKCFDDMVLSKIVLNKAEQTEPKRRNCTLELFDDDGNYIEPSRG